MRNREFGNRILKELVGVSFFLFFFFRVLYVAVLLSIYSFKIILSAKILMLMRLPRTRKCESVNSLFTV
jgi:hypothetical protein